MPSFVCPGAPMKGPLSKSFTGTPLSLGGIFDGIPMTPAPFANEPRVPGAPISKRKHSINAAYKRAVRRKLF